MRKPFAWDWKSCPKEHQNTLLIYTEKTGSEMRKNEASINKEWKMNTWAEMFAMFLILMRDNAMLYNVTQWCDE